MSVRNLPYRRPGRPRLLEPPEIPWTSSGHDQPRVLLECPPEKSPGIIAQMLEREGFEVVICEGPTSLAHCPLAAGTYCGTLQAVDVVVNLLEARYPERAEVLPALASAGPRPPAVVAEVDDSIEGGAGIHPIGRRAGANELVSALRAALRDHG